MSLSSLTSISAWRFDNRFVKELPADVQTDNRRRQVKHACYSLVNPTPVKSPQLIAHSSDMLQQLDLDESVIQADEFVQVFSGNQVLPEMQPFAMCYGGHQFGHWAGQLGDGRAINLGDVINKKGQRWTLQLKGAGPTPYSRTADGLAVLRSSLREFVCSEAMYHLGVPTTRALSLITTGESVVRDMFYDGHPAYEPGAVVCRVAPSFIRFGNFQILAARAEIDILRQLVDYTIDTDFAELDLPGSDNSERYVQWFDEVCQRTAKMIVQWMRVGFVHGVMNTDNMSILGLTIDYGPYGWLEDYNPEWTPNTTDANGRRYRFGHQSQIALWNLLQLAEAIYPLIEDAKPLEQSLEAFQKTYDETYRDMLAQKLGFEYASDEVNKLNDLLLELLQQVETDMTLFYRQLAGFDLQRQSIDSDIKMKTGFEACWYQSQQMTDSYLSGLRQWLQQYARLLADNRIDWPTRQRRMNRVNPLYVPRNYLAQMAIDQVEEGNNEFLHEWMEVLKHPYDEQADKQQFAEKRPEWARHRAGCSMLSCSS